MSDFAEHIAADARLVFLRTLHEETGGSLNEALLQKALEAFGLSRSRDFVRTQLRKLEELGAVKLSEAAGVLIATITRAGADHVERRTRIEGIARPSPEV